MRAKIIFITLAVDDLDRSVAFYRDGLGWQTEGIVAQEFHGAKFRSTTTGAGTAADGGRGPLVKAIDAARPEVP